MTQQAVITIANEAGSAGKTSTAVTVAGILAAEHGLTVRLIDLDPQANATWWLGHDEEAPGPTVGDVLTRRSTLDEATIATMVDGLTLVPSGRSLIGDSNELIREVGPEQRLRLAMSRSTTTVDVTIIDCPGALGTLTLAAMVASTSVVSVTTPSTKEISGLARLVGTTEEVADAFNPDLAVVAVVPCSVPPPSVGRFYADAYGYLEQEWGDLITPPVRRSVRIPEAYSSQTPLHLFAPNEAVTNDYRDVARALVQKAIARSATV